MRSENFLEIPAHSIFDCLFHLYIFRHCGISNCAWSEMQAFLSFLYTQLKDCEESSFCQIGSDDDQDLPGFGFFVVKFMLKMCQVCFISKKKKFEDCFA